jgi:hypothetical protein
MHASAIISFETKAEADKAIRNRLYIAGTSMRVVKYIPINLFSVKDAKDLTIQSIAVIKTTNTLYAPKTIPQDYTSVLPII